MQEAIREDLNPLFRVADVVPIDGLHDRGMEGNAGLADLRDDILAIESSGGFAGTYHVLMGHLSPIDGIGPEQLGMDVLSRRVEALAPSEVILATNLTVEGEATAHYIHDLLRGKVEKVSRIAHGVPLGGELEFIDGGTIVHAMQGRRNFS